MMMMMMAKIEETLYILFFGTCCQDGHEHVLEEIAKLCPPLQQSPKGSRHERKVQFF